MTPTKKPQEIVLETPPTKSSENHHERDGKTTLRNNAKPSIHAMNGSYKVQLATQTSIPLSRSHMKLSS
jgi:hypothetical protein